MPVLSNTPLQAWPVRKGLGTQSGVRSLDVNSKAQLSKYYYLLGHKKSPFNWYSKIINELVNVESKLPVWMQIELFENRV